MELVVTINYHQSIYFMEWHAGFDCMHTCMQAGLVVNMTLSPAIAAKIASAHDEQVRCCL